MLSQLSYVPRRLRGLKRVTITDGDWFQTPEFAVGVPGFEPGTSALSELRSNQLSYTPKMRAEVLQFDSTVSSVGIEFGVGSDVRVRKGLEHPA